MTAAYRAHAATIAFNQKGHPGAYNLLVRKLQGIVALSGPDVAALERITDQPRPFEAHLDLIRDGDAPETALIFLEGFACRYKQRQTGARQILSYLLPGDVCDADAADLGSLRYAIGTLSPCVVAEVPRLVLVDVMQQHPSILHAWCRMGRIELDTAQTWIENLGCRSALERMAHLFCELMTRLDAVGLAQKNTCPLPLTQADLGQTLGLSHVHVNRTLQEMRRQGLVELKGKSLQVFDLAPLKHIAEFDPAYLQIDVRANGCKAID